MGLFAVKKAFCRFDVNSIMPAEKLSVMGNILTEPKSTGPNPNINTTISFTANLPKEELYCPVLQCNVFDQICKGFSQPLIGTFRIPLGSILHE